MDKPNPFYKVPGPLCASRLDPDWIDQGTSARTRSPGPGPMCTMLRGDNNAGEEFTSNYPKQTADLAAWLIREGYIQTLAATLPPKWAEMGEAELGEYLRVRYGEERLQQMFLTQYSTRTTIKVNFRRINVVAAVLIGLIWARQNIKDGNWALAAGKVGAVTAATVGMNRLLYGRDATAAQILAKKGSKFGSWFKGAARSNFRVNLFIRLTVLTDIAAMSLSGGGEYPSIPFDLIYDIDVNDESTWRPPSVTLLSLGFNIWYRQKDTNIYLGKVEGSLIKTILENTIFSKPAY